MRLITDEQHAQIVGTLETAVDNAKGKAEDVHASYRGYYPERHAAVDRDVADTTQALAALQALPEVEVVGYVYGVMTDSCTRRSMANIKADIELKSGAPLYATKEPS